MKFDIKKNEYPTESRKFKVELTLAGFIGLASVLLLGLVWVFIFGVMVGKGFRPETAVPELAKIIPSKPWGNATQPDKNVVLKAEELQFYDKLKEPAGPAKPAPPGAPSGADQTKTLTAKADPGKTPVEEKNAAGQQPPAAIVDSKAAAQDAAKQAADKQKQAAPDPAKTQPGERFDYIYQVSSVRDLQSAERFRDNVRAQGLRSEIEIVQSNGTTWHRVLVHFQGRPEDTRELREKLKGLGSDKPLLHSKKPL